MEKSIAGHFPTSHYVAICAAVICVFGFIGNFLAMVFFLRQRRIRTHATSMFIINVGISNVIYSLTTLPIVSVTYWIGKCPFGDTSSVYCKIYPVLNASHLIVSMLSLTAVTINRSIWICKPENYGKIFTKKNVIMMVLTIWILSFVQSLPALTGTWGKLGLDSHNQYCTILPSNGRSSKLTINIGNVLIPSIIIIYCYFCIYKTVKRTDGISNPTLFKRFQCICITTTNENNNFSMVRIMLIIFLTLIFSYFPYTLILIFDPKRTMPVLYSILHMLFLTHVFIGPFILFYTNKLFNIALLHKIHPNSNFQSQNNISEMST